MAELNAKLSFKGEVCHFCAASITKRNWENNDCFQSVKASMFLEHKGKRSTTRSLEIYIIVAYAKISFIK